MSLNRLKTQECKNCNQITTVHSLFLGCMYKEIQIPPGSHVALREPVAIKSMVF